MKNPQKIIILYLLGILSAPFSATYASTLEEALQQLNGWKKSHPNVHIQMKTTGQDLIADLDLFSIGDIWKLRTKLVKPAPFSMIQFPLSKSEVGYYLPVTKMTVISEDPVDISTNHLLDWSTEITAALISKMGGSVTVSKKDHLSEIQLQFDGTSKSEIGIRKGVPYNTPWSLLFKTTDSGQIKSVHFKTGNTETVTEYEFKSFDKSTIEKLISSVETKNEVNRDIPFQQALENEMLETFNKVFLSQGNGSTPQTQQTETKNK